MLRRRVTRTADTRRDDVVTLIGKSDCHLCDEAERVVAKVCAELGTVWEKKDIAQDEDLHRTYWEQVPVVLVGGLQHTFWKVDEDRLRARLAEQRP
ncbi:glutaredoxin family protein [Streptomyces galilaeus]|uniref:glutaredoxin family protein n=1 Tax=Streptomyces galilaeus TaxID=33899 RepID=UPI0038F7D0BD